MSIKFNAADLIGALDKLETGIKEEVIRPAAEIAARTYRDEAILKAPRSAKGHWFYGTASKNAPKGEKKQHAYWIEPGTLASSIYEAYSPEKSINGKHVYHVSWNKEKAPHGFMVEFGTAKAAPHSFLRSSYYTAQERAFEAARQLIITNTQQVIDGLRI